MYANHFQFNTAPFQISTDPRFLWLGEQHKEALSILEYGIQENKGVIALSGDVGTGKTTLINALMSRIKDDVIAAVVTDPGLESLDFCYYIAKLYGITNGVNSKGDFLFHFTDFLKDAFEQKKRVLLVIDEAQRLSANLLEEIRLLSNIEQVGRRLLNLFLVGQNELIELLLKPENRSLKQRITIHFNLAPLTVNEVCAYIDHRLAVAGCQRRIFTKGAIREIFDFSKGFPRLINVICDQALISAFVKDRHKVTAAMVASSAKELQSPYEVSIIPPIANEPVETGTIAAITPPSARSNHQVENKRTRSREEHVLSFPRLAIFGSVLALILFSGYLLFQDRTDLPLVSSEPSGNSGQNYQTSAKEKEWIRPLESPPPILSPALPAEAGLTLEPGDDEKTRDKDKDKDRDESAAPPGVVASSSSPPEATVLSNALTDSPPVAEHPSGSASVTAKQGFQPTEVLPTPVSSETELGANASAAVPPPFASEADPSVTLSSSNEAAGAPSANASASLPTEANDKDPSAIIDWLIENKADDSSP